jgi:ribonuclease PH
MVLEDDGSVLSTSIMAAGLAFVDASIPCFDIIASSSAAFINGNILLDPNGKEEEIVSSTNPQENHGTVTISSLDSIDQISQIMFSGHIDPELLIRAKKQLLEINKNHVKYLKKVISLKIIKEHPES